MKKVTNKLKVQHYAQVPCKPFCVDVKDEYEAFKIVDTLARQHLFLFEQGIIQDYCNAICVVMFEEDSTDKGWVDYFNDHEGLEWDEIEEMIRQEVSA